MAAQKSLWDDLHVCEVWSVDAKLGGNPINFADITDGITWLNKSHLEKVKCSSPKFSWSNRQLGDSGVYSKIDWIFL